MSKMLVKSVRPAYRRAGLEFSQESRVLDVAQLTPEQVAAIKNDPNLIAVEYVEPKADDKGKGK